MTASGSDDSLPAVARQLAQHLRWWLAAGLRGLPAPEPVAAATAAAGAAFPRAPSPAPPPPPLLGQTQQSAARAPAHQTSLFASAAPETDTASETPAPPDPDQAAAQLLELQREIGECQRCRLHRGRNSIVFGEGNPAARLVFAGEGPGRDEDASGRPFVGRAGQLLDRIIAAMGFQREECYICNVVKCRPPDNRTPRDDEMLTCGQFLSRQLEIIRPRFIVALGATAARYLTGTQAPMGKLRGRFFGHPSGARILPTYHPAYLLRNPSAKKQVWQDVQKVMAQLPAGNRESPP